MHPELIKAQIRMRGTTPAAIADELGVSRPAVIHVINGRNNSARIRAAIALAAGIPAATLWPPQAPSGLRRARPGCAVCIDHARGVAA